MQPVALQQLQIGFAHFCMDPFPLHAAVCLLYSAGPAPLAGTVVWEALKRLAGCGPFVSPAKALKVGNYVHPWVHPVHEHVLL